MKAARGLVGSLADARREDAEAYVALANLHASVGDAPQGLWLLEEGLQRFPDRADLRLALAGLALTLGDAARARSVAEQIPPSSELHLDALLLRAQTELQLGKSDAGLQLLREAETKYPDRPQARMARALALLGEKRVDEARAALEEARAQITDPRAQRQVEGMAARVQFSQGDFEGGLQRATALVQGDPRDLESQTNLVEMLLRSRGPDAALAQVEQAIAASPQQPALRLLAAQVQAALAQSSWTKVSMASLLTSLWPRSHAVKKLDDGLGEGALTLGEVLGDAGYRRYAVQTNGWLAQSFGFQQGFERYIFPATSPDEGLGGVWPHADTLFASLVGLLDEHPVGEPFLLYLHFMDVHEYAAPPDVPRRAPGNEGAYEAAVTWVDEVLGRVRAELERRDLLGRTILVLASDHGEEFGEHGVRGHARHVLSGVLRVPWIVRLPFPMAPVRVAPQVRNLDLAPTLLELLGLPIPESFEGQSLVAQIDGAHDGADLPSFASLPTRMYPDAVLPESLSDGRWTLVRDSEDGRELLSDRSADPGENVNLVALEPAEAQRLRALLARHLAEPPRPATVKSSVRIDPGVAEKLRAVGYLK